MNMDEKIFLTRGNRMVGGAIKKIFIQKGYGNPRLGGRIFFLLVETNLI